MLWFNFILGLNFIFLCFKVIIMHYHTPKQRTKLNYNIYNIFVFPVQFFNHCSSLLMNVLLLTDVLKMFKIQCYAFECSLLLFCHTQWIWITFISLSISSVGVLQCLFVLYIYLTTCTLFLDRWLIILLWCCDDIKEKYFLVYKYVTAGKCHWKPLNGQLPSR